MDNFQPGHRLNILIAEIVLGWEEANLGKVPQYSTDIAVAWGLVEELRLVVRPSLLHGWVAGKLKAVRASGLIEIEAETYAEAETAPLAICLAALKVVEPFL